MWCPHCGEQTPVRDGNGIYICPDCEHEVEVHVFDGCFTTQPDDVTCGWAVSMWLLKSFRLRVPSGKRLREELNVDKSWLMPDGTLPLKLKEVMENRGLREVLEGDGEDEPFSVRNPSMNWLFDRHGRVAVCYACIDPFKRRRGSFAHWVGLEMHAREIRVMDPIDYRGYVSLRQWHRENRRLVDYIVAAYGFVKC